MRLLRFIAELGIRMTIVNLNLNSRQSLQNLIPLTTFRSTGLDKIYSNSMCVLSRYEILQPWLRLTHFMLVWLLYFIFQRYSICIVCCQPSAEWRWWTIKHNTILLFRVGLCLWLRRMAGKWEKACRPQRKCRLFIGFSHVQWLPAPGDFQ